MATQKQIDKLWAKAERLQYLVLRYGALAEYYERKQQKALAEFQEVEALARALEAELKPKEE